MTGLERRQLRLTYHGRIIDHLGIQMYQSAVAALAELVANAWDADAESVRIELPDELGPEAEIVIRDDGSGMTFEECQDRYLNVGLSRRGDQLVELSPAKARPILGRKGIGKFAGFGIAQVIRVETVSAATGERSVFEMDIRRLRGDTFAETGGEVDVIDYEAPAEARTDQHGTVVRLRSLVLGRRPSPDAFSRSMARRFLLHQRVDDFNILVNGQPLPGLGDGGGIQFGFPGDYRDEERPEGLVVSEGWGRESLPNGKQIDWQVVFYEDTIDEEELRGVAVFSHGKLVQIPFFFNLSGGLGGQHGQAYISGRVQADYLDELPEDIMATERQRVNWEHPEARPLLEWGQERVKQLLRIWHDRRGEARQRLLEERLAGFSARLDRLPKHERETVRRAVRRVAQIPTLTAVQFEELGGAILSAWEQGRLRDLINDISGAQELSAEQFLDLLVEANVLAALNVAEAVRTKLDAIRGLRRRIEAGELENAVRDYIAEKPWLLDPEWETFRVERSVKAIMAEAAASAGLAADPYRGRVDLALRSGEQLLVVEFVRPSQRVDWDHLSRCRRYVLRIRSAVQARTALGIQRVRGLVVADELDRTPEIAQEIEELHKSGIVALDWRTLLGRAEQRWDEFLDILIERAPEDERLKALRVETAEAEEPVVAAEAGDPGG